jgi:chromosome segregation ATPase
MSDTVDKAKAWDEIAKKNAELATLRANYNDLRHNCSRLNEANERLRAALTNLVVQVDRSNAVDDHGHELKNLAALADAREALGK